MTVAKAYEELIDFIAIGTNPDTLIAFQPSKEAKERLAELIAGEKTEGLSSEELSELNHYLQLEHLMRLAKARARQYLTSEVNPDL